MTHIIHGSHTFQVVENLAKNKKDFMLQILSYGLVFIDIEYVL